MKFEWFRITNFRSVVDSGKINSENMMVFLGKNQSGKSSILQGLSYLSFKSEMNAKAQLTLTRKIKSKYDDGSLSANQLPIANVYFSFTEDEIDGFSKKLTSLWSPNFKPENKVEEFFQLLYNQCTKTITASSEPPPEEVEELGIEEIEEELVDGEEIEESSPKKEEMLVLDEEKFQKLIHEKISGVELKKFVDGNYSLQINELVLEFENPHLIEFEFEEIGQKMWSDLKADFDRAPNKPFFQHFDDFTDDLVRIKFGQIKDNKWKENFSKLETQGYDQPLKDKLKPLKEEGEKLLQKYNLSSWIISLISIVYENIPEIAYFSSYERLEDSLTIEELKKNPEQHKTFVNLLELADIDLDHVVKIKDDPGSLKQYLMSNSGDVTKKIQDVYKQEKVILTIEYSEGKMMVFFSYPNAPATYLFPSSGSAGFQWYLGFYINFSVYTESRYKNAILILDDPGVLLHPSGHKDLLNELKGYVKNNVMTIIATHLPSLIPKDNFSSIRVVDKQNVETTVVENFWKLSNHDAWAPVRAALGVDFTDSLLIGKKTILVEGPSDIIYLQGFRRILEQHVAEESEDFILPISGIANTNYYISLLDSQKLPYVPVLDKDDKYPEIKTSKVIQIKPKNQFKKNQQIFDIEDLLEPDAFIYGLTRIHPDLNKEVLLKKIRNNSTAKKYNVVLKEYLSKQTPPKEIDKVRISKECVNYVTSKNEVFKNSIENFKDLFEKINKKINIE